jgi:RND family efflux transporter MFP subunit
MENSHPRCLQDLVFSSLLFGAGAAGVFFFSGCSDQPTPEAQPPAVRTTLLGEQIASPFRRFPGEVSAVQTSEMSFDVAGRLIERPASQGAVFQQGDLLARLDPENFQASVDSARSRFNNAREELTRQTQLRERGVISVAELDRFRTEFEVTEAALRQAERALADTRLLAPFDGRVARTLINNFQSIRANEPILIFQNVSELDVDIDVPESVFTLWGQGMTAEKMRPLIEARVEFPALTGRDFPVLLKSFRTAADPTSRTFRVTFLLDPPADAGVLPGMTGTVLVRRMDQNATDANLFAVPVPAVDLRENGPVVWRVQPETSIVEAVPVELDIPQGDTHRIRSAGLEPGDEIVTAGVRFLNEGMAVRRHTLP